MDITIPIYVETTAGSRQGAEYRVRPLFSEAPIERSRLLSTALQKLTKSLRRQLVELGRQQRHDALAAWSSCPELETQQCRIRIERDGTIIRLRLLLIMLRRFQRRLAFSPAFPDLWFDLLPDEDPELRLTEALTAHLRKLVAEGHGIDHDSLLQRSLEGTAWVTEIQLQLSPERVRAGKRTNAFAMLGSAEQMDGEWELYRVGRSLNDLDLHDVSRAVLRESEVRELEQVLNAKDRRPVLLLGRRQSGKTTVLHEYVLRTVERAGNQQGEARAVWLISPQRLISGMSYVGQWESRFHAIMKFAARRDLVLYFDDLVGLFQAGVTSQSTISAAALLKTIMMHRTVRVCGELTPEEFRVLQERDRSFADQFHVIRVEELAGDANLRVLLGLQRQLEVRYGVRFQLETLPAIIDLQRRYVRDAAFPGKAAGLMKRLAVRFGAESEDASAERRRTVLISQENVFEFFRQQSGLPLSFLDQRTRLERGQMISALRERFVGQPQAVSAAVEIISIARARLNDPSRPLATLLLLGPTGVGKTEFARSVAACLFGSAERLLRFDMNEFVSPTAVPLLAGTFSQPDGLLTAAVRRQPFAVLLFDEIEKAHPNVFDLLLQVLGEGRLTDARGRTTDFSNTLILLTSNLGTQRSETSLGFGGAAEEGCHPAIRAAEQFFRPEFFNRLDRVIPFARLSRADVQEIARHLLTGVLRREGLVRRQCVLNSSPAVTDWIVEQGFNPVLGARALKRVIERELAQPVSTLLADFPAEAGEADRKAQAALSLIEVDRGPSGLIVSLRWLSYREAQQPRSGDSGDGDQRILAEIERILLEVAGRLPELRTTGVFDTSSLTPAQSRYLLVQEELRCLRELHGALTAAVANAAAGPSHAPAMSRRGRGRRAQPRQRSGRADLRELIAEVKIDEEIDEVFQKHDSGDWQTLSDLQHPDVLLARCCRLRKLSSSDVSRLDESVTLQVTVLDSDRIACLRTWSQWFVKGWVGAFPGAAWGLNVSVHEDAVNRSSIELRIQGVLACDVADCERGFQLLEIQGQPSRTLLRISGVNEPAPDVVVRQLRISSDLTRIPAPGVEQLYLQTWRLQPD